MRGSGEGGASLESVIGRIDATEPGTLAADTVPSGFPSLDRVLGGGLRQQDLAILAGDVGSGKSALALGMVTAASQRRTASTPRKACRRRNSCSSC